MGVRVGATLYVDVGAGESVGAAITVATAVGDAVGAGTVVGEGICSLMAGKAGVVVVGGVDVGRGSMDSVGSSAHLATTPTETIAKKTNRTVRAFIWNPLMAMD